MDVTIREWLSLGRASHHDYGTGTARGRGRPRTSAARETVRQHDGSLSVVKSLNVFLSSGSKWEGRDVASALSARPFHGERDVSFPTPDVAIDSHPPCVDVDGADGLEVVPELNREAIHLTVACEIELCYDAGKYYAPRRWPSAVW